MPSKPRNLPEQEHSIKERSNELFFDESTLLPARASKPFAAYLRETPARPVSPALKVLFWILAAIVGALFLAAVWRVAHRHGGRLPTEAAAAKLELSALDRRSAAAG